MLQKDTLSTLTVRLALSFIGEKEATGQNDGPFVEMLQSWMDEGEGWMKGQPWCATFASWVIARAGLDLGVSPRVPKSASTTDLFNWFKAKGLLLASPTENCIGMLRGDGGTPGKNHHHTFLVEKVVGATVHGIDGNWQNSVCRTVHNISECDFGPIV